MDFHKLSLVEQLEGLKKGDFTSTELTTNYLKRIYSYLIRFPDKKKYSWEDLKKIRKKIKDLSIKI